MEMGGFDFTAEDTSFSFGGFDFFAGAWADYEGDVQLDLQGLEPSTAQVMIGTMAPIDVVSGSDAESIKFHWEGMQLEAFQAVRRVASILSLTSSMALPKFWQPAES